MHGTATFIERSLSVSGEGYVHMYLVALEGVTFLDTPSRSGIWRKSPAISATFNISINPFSLLTSRHIAQTQAMRISDSAHLCLLCIIK